MSSNHCILKMGSSAHQNQAKVLSNTWECYCKMGQLFALQQPNHEGSSDLLSSHGRWFCLLHIQVVRLLIHSLIGLSLEISRENRNTVLLRLNFQQLKDCWTWVDFHHQKFSVLFRQASCPLQMKQWTWNIHLTIHGVNK